jgi:hypothetical protein
MPRSRRRHPAFRDVPDRKWTVEPYRSTSAAFFHLIFDDFEERTELEGERFRLYNNEALKDTDLVQMTSVFPGADRT